MNTEYKIYTNRGERPVNEDSVGVYEKDGFYTFVLCDGLGGHGMGDVASSMTVDVVRKTAAKLGFDDKTIGQCFEEANTALTEKQNENSEFASMRTTGTILMIKDMLASWGHIGDSRIYYFKKKKLIGRTEDHSVPQMLVNSGDIKEKEIRFHPDRNRLLRCIPWPAKKYQIDNLNHILEPGDCFMMMSDGFWEWVDEKQMKKCLKKYSDIGELCDQLVAEAFENGKGKGMDNLSVIIVKIN